MCIQGEHQDESLRRDLVSDESCLEYLFQPTNSNTELVIATSSWPSASSSKLRIAESQPNEVRWITTYSSDTSLDFALLGTGAGPVTLSLSDHAVALIQDDTSIKMNHNFRSLQRVIMLYLKEYAAQKKLEGIACCSTSRTCNVRSDLLTRCINGSVVTINNT